MFTSIVFAAMLTAPTADGKPDAKKELFAKEDWYKDQAGKETDFVGVLKYAPRAKGVVGFGRFNAYRLEMGEKLGVREVYVGGMEEILKAYDGKTVKLSGKAVDMEVEGRMHQEIWPARVELVAEKDRPKRGEKD